MTGKYIMVISRVKPAMSNAENARPTLLFWWLKIKYVSMKKIDNENCSKASLVPSIKALAVMVKNK